jgi:hypothetical protein
MLNYSQSQHWSIKFQINGLVISLKMLDLIVVGASS